MHREKNCNNSNLTYVLLLKICNRPVVKQEKNMIKWRWPAYILKNMWFSACVSYYFFTGNFLHRKKWTWYFFSGEINQNC